MPVRVYLRAAALVGSHLVVLGALGWRAAVAGSLGERFAWSALAAVWLAAGLLAAHLFYERLDLSGRTRARLRPGESRLALTFDDGPNGPYTAQVLAALARHQVRATFFLVGERAQRQPDLVRRMVEDGHAVGNHGLTHAILSFRGRAAVEREIAEAQRALAEAGAGDVRLFRAPHGFKSLLWGAALDRLGLQLCAWTRGVWDTDAPGAAVIARRALRGLRDGEILLLHDGGDGADRSQTVAALEEILGECRRRGFRFVTLPEGLAEDGRP